ncbi:MAG: PAS domain S-box protein [Deltaproteobacteria bacterium]
MYKNPDAHKNDFFSILDNVPDAMVVTNNEGKIVLINHQTEKLFGYSEEELLGETVEILLPERFRKEHKRHRGSYYDEPKVRPMGRGISVIGRRRDGSEVPLEISLSPWRNGDEFLVISAIRDITERERTEKELKWKNKNLEMLNTVTQAVHKSHDLDEVYKIALDMATELENVDIACIYLVDRGRKEAVLQAYRNLPEEYIGRAQRIPYSSGITWEVINSGKVLNIENIQKDPNIGQAGKSLGHLAVLGIPITSREGVIGVIWFSSYKERTFGEQEVALLTSIGDQIATAIAKAKLYRDLARKSRYEEIIRTVVQNVHSSLDLQEVLENAAVSLIENIEVVDIVGIYMVEGEEAVLKAHGGLTDSYIKRAGRIPYPKGFTWKTILEGEPRYCADAGKDNYIGPAGKKEGIKSYLSMPLVNEDKTVGCINITSKQKNTFDREELKLLEAVSHQISVAIKNAKQAELLLESEERLSAVLNNTPNVSIQSYDIDGRVLYWNKAAENIFGWSRDQALGKTLDQLILDKESTNEFVSVLKSVDKSNEPFGPSEWNYKGREGNKGTVYSTIFPIPSSGGKKEFICMDIDITERKRMEEELLKVQKLESVGILAGGIAHDFNNLLTGIMGNISVARLRAEKGRPINEMLQEAEKATLRATNLTSQLLTFSKGEAPIKQLSSLDDIIRESAGFVLTGSNVRCEYTIPSDLWSAEVDKGQISQVINNLVINAQQAMPEGGVIRLSAENTTEVKKHNTLREGRYVRISVKDSGTGIPKEYLQKIFDPYFTTKQRGSGLGLAICYSIINKHAGLITVNSEMGEGTIFSVYIPASGERIQKYKEGVKNVLEDGEGRILVMDDEEMIRKVVEFILEDTGYEVRFAKDGAEALELYKEAMKRGNAFDAVILDLTVPGGMGGKETMENLIMIDPNVRGIVSSGYLNDPEMADFEKYGFKGIVSKPYDVQELIMVLHKVICTER